MTPISPNQAKALLNTLAHIDMRRTEDALVLETLIRTGVRSIEAVQMTANDLDPETGTLQVHAAKGSKDHLVPLPQTFAKRLHAHLTKYGTLIGYYTATKSLEDRTRRLRDIFARNRSLFPPNTSLHSLRAAFAILIYTKTRDIMLTKDMLGHRSLNSTDAYVQIVRTFARRKDILKSFK
jgi:integrase